MLRRNEVCYSLGIFIVQIMSTSPCGQVSLLSPRQAMECKDIKPLAVGVTCNRPEILPRSRKWMVATWWIKFAVGMNHLKYSSLDICFWLNLFLISPSANIPIPSPSSPLIFNFRRIHRKVHPLKISLKACCCTHSGTRLGGACGCKIFTGVLFLQLNFVTWNGGQFEMRKLFVLDLVAHFITTLPTMLWICAFFGFLWTSIDIQKINQLILII